MASSELQLLHFLIVIQSLISFSSIKLTQPILNKKYAISYIKKYKVY